MPLAAITSRSDLGIALRNLRILVIPEERDPPRILVRANELAATLQEDGASIGELLRQNRRLRDAHGHTLVPQQPRARGDVDADLIIAKAKIEEADTIEQGVGFLTTAETRSLLSDPQGFQLLIAKAASSIRQARKERHML